MPRTWPSCAPTTGSTRPTTPVRRASRPTTWSATHARLSSRRPIGRSLNALEAAERFYDQALALWPDEGLDRDLLAIRRVTVGVLQSTPIDRDEIAALSERLVAAGHPAEAAVAETALSVSALDANDRELSSLFEQRSLQLLEGLPSRETAFVLAYVARSRIAHVRFEEAIEVAQRGREVAEALGDREGVIAALTTIGTCTASVGGDLTMLEDAIERAAAVRSPEYTRGLTNLASILVDRGSSTGASTHRSVHSTTASASEVHGGPWSRAELGYTRHLQGRWDEALVFVEAVIRYVEGGTAHYIAPLALTVRASIRVARDDVAGALEDSGRAAELALRTDDQMVPGALGPRLGVLLHAGLHDEARTTAEELFARQPSATLLWESRAWAALEELGMLERLVAPAPRAARPTGTRPAPPTPRVGTSNQPTCLRRWAPGPTRPLPGSRRPRSPRRGPDATARRNPSVRSPSGAPSARCGTSATRRRCSRPPSDGGRTTSWIESSAW